MSRRLLLDLAIMLLAFALCSAVAGLAGAPNLGTALTFGQIGFALAAVYVLLRRAGPPSPARGGRMRHESPSRISV
jgi:hypothetical protein